ncbi:hypothetical protein, partial [Leptonema illini]
GKPDAGNLHVRFDEGEGCRASGTLSTLLVNGFSVAQSTKEDQEEKAAGSDSSLSGLLCVLRDLCGGLF